tara:strand:- start:207 stop:377 length:171 start_codon:yes stop_codon:yes gene_type:complete
MSLELDVDVIVLQQTTTNKQQTTKYECNYNATSNQQNINKKNSIFKFHQKNIYVYY